MEDKRATFWFDKCYALLVSVKSSSAGVLPKVVSVVSTKQGEGKTTVSAYLALSLAKGGHKVCIVDLNLRTPGLHRFFKQPDGEGLSDVLKGKAELMRVCRDIEGCCFLPGGPVVSDPASFINSKLLGEIINELKDQYEIVILDTPSLGDFTDALVISQYSEYIIYVISYGDVSKDEVEESIGLLRDKNIGIVFNRVRE
jgi:capsular exopolysaccharide synthesis family protein